MKFKIHKKYFIRLSEFKQLKRNPFIAGILSIIFGFLGIHRFYSNRLVTGLIFLFISIYSIKMDNILIGFLILFCFLEGIVYLIEGLFFLKEKFVKYRILKANKKIESKENRYIKEKENQEESKVIENSEESNTTLVEVAEPEKENQEESEVIGKAEESNTALVEVKEPEKENQEESEVIGKVEEETIREVSEIDQSEEDIEIIDVSTLEVSPIEYENIEVEESIKNNWIEKLDIPYERKIMEIDQIKYETLRFYFKLCEFIDKKLKDKKSSLNEEIASIEREGGYYSNILYTIYCISEGYVTKKYSGGYNYYNPDYSYQLLEKHLGSEMQKDVLEEANRIENHISSPNEETRRYFDLMDCGIERTWWDKDGSIRSSRKFNTEEANILNLTPTRNTTVWNIYEIRKRIVYLYIDLWKTILDGLYKEFIWQRKNKKIIKNIIKHNNRYYLTSDEEKILSSLIRIAENSVRKIMPNTQLLDVDYDKKIISKYLPKEIISGIEAKIYYFEKSIGYADKKEILEDMISLNPSDWKLKVEEILMLRQDEDIEKLIEYSEDDNFVKIAKNIIRESENEKLLLLCLYCVETHEKLSQKNSKLLNQIINPNNMDMYEDLIEAKETLSTELLEKLLELRKAKRKKIELNMEKVEISKKELNKTVDILKEYIGEESEEESENINNNRLAIILENNKNTEINETENEIEEDEKVDITDDDQKENLKYIDFLKLIVDKEKVSIKEGKEIALNNNVLLNVFISNVNGELYDYIQDQAILIEDDCIKIDDFYVDMVKELVNNEE
ncbi:TM2 domain-containing protein [Peptostreptococcus russellii]|uniref:TM2 domain-containing protein n=1 Tax=Peptostreptococcus russellii TaxID=215200 RepID=UPI0026EBB5CD|nr:tellurite resistance TerB C-terminal domain-containing protein [Peptostreptococcus russellii]